MNWRFIDLSLILLFIFTAIILINPYSNFVFIGDAYAVDSKVILSTNNYQKALYLEDVFWIYAIENVNISGIEIPAGTSALVLSLKNFDSDPVYNITVDFSSLLEIADCNETIKHYNSSLDPGYSVTFIFKASLRDNATASEYDLPMMVYYFKNNNLYYYDLDVPIAVSGVPILKVKATPLYVNEEGVYDIYFEIQNIGTSPARRTIAYLIAYPPYINSYDEDWIFVGIIPANKTRTCKFRIYVSDMLTNAIPIIINVTFMDQRTNNFYSIAESILVIYNESPHVILVSSSYVPASVFPGDKFVKLTVTISNPTRKIIENASAKLMLSDEFSASYAMSTEFSIGTLMPGQLVTLSFYVDVADDAQPGMKKLYLEVSFNGGNNIYEIPIIVKEKAKFMITDYNPKTLPRGGRGIVFKISIKNIANVDAEAIYLQLLGGTVLKGEVVTYVGKLVSGEETSVTFTIEISDSAPLGQVSFDLKITWTQEDRFLSEIYKITVLIISGSAISNLSGLIIGLALIASGILLIPVIREIRKIAR